MVNDESMMRVRDRTHTRGINTPSAQILIRRINVGVTARKKWTTRIWINRGLEELFLEMDWLVFSPRCRLEKKTVFSPLLDLLDLLDLGDGMDVDRVVDVGRELEY